MSVSYGKTVRLEMKSTIMIMDDSEECLKAMNSLLKEAYPAHDIILFDNAPDTIEWLKNNISSVVLISLDHDLGPNKTRDGEIFDPGTGRDVADYLITKDPVCPVIVHSTNHVARDGMIFALEGSGWQTSYVIPYNDLKWIKGMWAEEIKKWLRETPS